MAVLRSLIQAILFAIVLGVGVTITAVLSRRDPIPRVENAEDAGRLVDAFKVARRDFSSPIVSYGTARAAGIHSVKAQVGGKIVRRSDSFAEGKRVTKGEFLFELDKRDLEIAILEREANIQQAVASMAEIQTREVPVKIQIDQLRQKLADLQRSLANDRQKVASAQATVERERTLVAKGASTQANLERAQIELASHEAVLVSTESQIAQIPHEIQGLEVEIKTSIPARLETLKAQKAAAEAGLQKARYDLERTVVNAPSDGVLIRSPTSTKVAEEGDFLAPGEDAGLLILDLHAGIEIPTSIDLADAQWFRGMVRDIEIRADQLEKLLPSIGDVEVIWFRDPKFKWIGKVDRAKGELDPSTRTLTIIIRVDDPGETLVVGKKMPLAHGMFCRIEIPGFQHENALVVPRSAVRPGNKLHLITKGALEIREIEPLQVLEEHVVVAKGLEAGEWVVTTDLPAAVPGTKLRRE